MTFQSRWHSWAEKDTTDTANTDKSPASRPFGSVGGALAGPSASEAAPSAAGDGTTPESWPQDPAARPHRPLLTCRCCRSRLAAGSPVCPACTTAADRGALIAYAAALAPPLRFTLVETEHLTADFALVRRIRHLIAEHQPGDNHVCLTVVTLDGRRVRAEWRALATRALRLGIGRLLAREGLRRRTPAQPTPRWGVACQEAER